MVVEFVIVYGLIGIVMEGLGNIMIDRYFMKNGN